MAWRETPRGVGAAAVLLPLRGARRRGHRVAAQRRAERAHDAHARGPRPRRRGCRRPGATPVDTGAARRDSADHRSGPARPRRTSSRPRRWRRSRRAGPLRPRGSSRCAASRRGFRSTDGSSSPTAGRTRTRCSRDEACSCSRSCWRSSASIVGDELRLGGQPFTIRGVVTRDRVQRAAASRSDRASTSISPISSRRRSSASAAARTTRCCCRVDASAIDRVTRAFRRSSGNDLGDRAVVARARGSPRPEPDARGELSEPRRLRDRRARRHRRLERHARARAAEDQERRDPEVPRRLVAAGAGDLRAAGRLGWRRRQRARRRPGGGRPRLDSDAAARAARHHLRRRHAVGGRAGRGGRPAGVAALRARAAARDAARQAAAAAARRHGVDGAAARLGEPVRVSRAWRRPLVLVADLAGRLAARRRCLSPPASPWSVWRCSA